MPNADDPRRLCARADRARLKGRVRRAIRLYERALEAGPENSTIRRKLAPLLARSRRFDEAWVCYQAAADSLESRGFEARSAGLMREATTLLPRNDAAWRRLAALLHGLGRTTDARNALLEARPFFRGRRHRPAAVELLGDAFRMAPDDAAIGLELATLLRKTRQRDASRVVLQRLLERVPSEDRRLRFELFRSSPSLDSLGDLIRAMRQPVRPVSREAR